MKLDGVLMLIGLMAATSFGGEKQIALYTVGNVDASMQARVVKWVGEQLMTVTNTGALASSATLTLAAVQDLGKARLVTNTVAVLILADGLSGMEGRHALAQGNVVVVSVGALRSADAETWSRRVEKESVGGLAFVLGMEPCLLPICVLCPTPMIEDLDLKGRGLCPPCMGRWVAKGVEKGIRDPE